ncbi:hypothetical protein G3I59_32710 [Amycolatopsis rubida]|uniref:Uncharacterized protein n=1 Tax=Amycolatopsis rubida TaxID=112413 RepID=A0ABX0C168_9PSEU|nr:MULTISPECIES: hypothetical protein [Amycolatopsis]MYW95234.1 hypothetical protein [Amycolatopsis rubida]NEC60222.1 hypothetical protein [Amycolatopsis rubida]OAP28368.1 hypothetical protein A4R44_00155 [Amycolatopsis sp. M39]
MRDLAAAQREREQHLAALRREIDDTTRMIKNLVRDFSRNDTPSEDFVRDINTERAELHHRKIELEAQLAEAEEANQRAPNPDRSTPCP